jgi:hypothetical protein
MLTITVIAFILALIYALGNTEMTLNNKPLTTFTSRLFWGFVGNEIVLTVICAFIYGLYKLLF